MAKKIFLSIVSGLVILAINWVYQNYDFTFRGEDKFFKKISFIWKNEIIRPTPKQKAQFVFINTGKDLTLVEDSVDYGNVAISDREKIYRFLQFVNSVEQKPVYTVLDIQFYYPYTPNLQIDSLLAAEISKNNKIIIPVVNEPIVEGYKKPLYNARYGYSDYITYGLNFNKFQILNKGPIESIPVGLHKAVNGAVYNKNSLFSTCNGKLCFSAIWVSHFITNDDVMEMQQVESLNKIETTDNGKNKKFHEYYNIGEILFDFEINPAAYKNFFKDKIVMIGNFQEDTHPTMVGTMSGPVLLANIYLTLLNGQHIVPVSFLIISLLVFSGLSYLAWFGKIPELKFKFKFFFSDALLSYIRKFISYFGALFVLFLIAMIFFNVQVPLFVPSWIFATIEIIRQNKSTIIKNLQAINPFK